MAERVVAVGGVECGAGAPLLVIAGPCVIEDAATTDAIAAGLVDAVADLPVNLVFKASFDKANRTSLDSYRGPGLAAGLEVLAEVAERHGLPVTTDVHLPEQAAPVAEVCDLLQIPAFLSRQTDLLVAAARTGRALNVKKGQFMAPTDMRHVVEKVRQSGNDEVLVCERGTFFGYGRLVNDFTGLVAMRELAPVVFDATHSVQRPGGDGATSGGDGSLAPHLARAAAAVGIDGLFLETHIDPSTSPSDGPNMVPLDQVGAMLRSVVAIRQARNRTVDGVSGP